MYLLNGDSANRKLTYSNDGKAARENTFVLSSDGKTIRETDITPASSPAKMSVTLHKSQRRHSVLSFWRAPGPASGDLPVDQIFW